MGDRDNLSYGELCQQLAAAEQRAVELEQALRLTTCDLDRCERAVSDAFFKETKRLAQNRIAANEQLLGGGA